MVRLAPTKGVWSCMFGVSPGIRSVFVFVFLDRRLEQRKSCLLAWSLVHLLPSSVVLVDMVAAPVHLFLRFLARRLSYIGYNKP
jgi:hypothetical protein